jgi:O-acetylserine/cysteine efflux transporter
VHPRAWMHLHPPEVRNDTCRNARRCGPAVTFRHFLLALATVMFWGFNYVVIKWGLQGVPPILLSVLRFTLTGIPLVFFLPLPRIPRRLLAGFVFFQFILQFIMLFVGMHLGMPAGLSSLVIQVQSFFTIGLAALFLGDRPHRLQWFGAPIALAGIALVAIHLEARMTLVGFAMVVAAGLSWSFGNLIIKRIGMVDALALVVWSGLLASPFLLLVSLALEGPALIWTTLTHLSWVSMGTILFQAYPATLFSFTAWTYLMRRYPAATIAPFSLLVPVFGMLSSMLFLGEPMTWWKATAGVLVIGGLALNLFGNQAIQYCRRAQPAGGGPSA